MEIKILGDEGIDKVIQIPDGESVNLSFVINCPNLKEMSSGATIIRIGNEDMRRMA